MQTDYEYYLLGCLHKEVMPLSQWRFTVSYAKYRQMVKWEMDQWRGLAPKQQSRIVRRWYLLRTVAGLVRLGQDLVLAAAHADFFSDGNDDAGSAGAGDREPRVPLSPVLTGCGVRTLPYPDPNACIERQL